MNLTIIDAIGYLGLVINLYAMSTKGEYRLRFFSIIANTIYIIYGSLLAASPIVIGCIIAVILHGYHLRRIIQLRKN